MVKCEPEQVKIKWDKIIWKPIRKAFSIARVNPFPTRLSIPTADVSQRQKRNLTQTGSAICRVIQMSRTWEKTIDDTLWSRAEQEKGPIKASLNVAKDSKLPKCWFAALQLFWKLTKWVGRWGTKRLSPTETATNLTRKRGTIWL